METIIIMLVFYYTFVFAIVGIAGSLAIILTEEVCNIDKCLSDTKEFICCVFMYQFAIKYFLEDYINTIGIVILEVLATLSVWFLNISIFLVLLFLLLIKAICYGFWLVFRKNDSKETHRDEV